MWGWICGLSIAGFPLGSLGGGCVMQASSVRRAGRFEVGWDVFLQVWIAAEASGLCWEVRIVLDASGLFLRRRARRRPGARGATIAVRSLRSGLPLRHLRPPSAPFRFPRAYRRPARPGPPPHRTLAIQVFKPLGRSACLAFLCRAFRARSILRCPSPFGRAGGLRRLTRRLATW